MPRWAKVTIAAAVPSMAGVLAWWICVASGFALDVTSIVVGLVVLLPATPLAIWAGQSGDPPPGPHHDPHPVPAVIGEIPREPKAFQLRSDLGERIEQVLSARGAVPVCALAGGRGVGKTQLAAAYARRCIDQGIPAVWLHAESVEQLHGSLDQMATELGLRDDTDDATTVARKVRTWLQERREPYLVVVDNATDPDLLAPLLPSHGRARVLITTNDQSFERLATAVTVEQFTDGEAMNYLRARVGTSDSDGFGTLAEELGHLPLALAIAAAALVGPPRLSCNAYLRRLHATSIEEFLARPRGEPYPRGVAQAIMLSVGETGAESTRLLGELAVLSASGVGLELLAGPAETALAELGARSLVTFSRDGTTAFVHRLVRRAVRDGAARDGTLAETIESAAQRLRVVVEGVTDEDTWRRFPTIMAVADHGAALWEATRALTDDGSVHVQTAAVAVLDVRQLVVHHLLYLNDHVRAVPIAQAVAAGREDLLGAEHADTLAALHDLAHAYDDGLAHSIALYDRVAAVRARNLGDDHWETLWARACAAFAYTTAGQASEGARLLVQVVADQERVLDPDHETALRTRYFQAHTDIEAGRLEQGIAELERLIADHERLFDRDYPETWVVKGQLARAYRMAGRTDDAIRTYRQVADVQARVLTVDHPDTLITRHGLAAAYESAGRTTEALAEYESVTDRFEAVMGAGQALTRAASIDRDRVRRSLQRR